MGIYGFLSYRVWNTDILIAVVIRMSAHKYEKSCKDLAMWKEHELGHVGRIAAVKDKDLQYSYALSTVNGMMHLRDALYEKVVDPKTIEHHRLMVQRDHDAVVRVIQHLIKDYGIDVEAIRKFNVRNVLRPFNYLKVNTRRVRFTKSNKAKKSKRTTQKKTRSN
jgi:hypothetical protein